MLKRIFNSKINNFTSAALFISGSTILSGILGLLRDRLLAGKFGAGEVLDVYFAAFRIPDLLQATIVAGGITAAFLPVFSEEFEKDKKKAFMFANNILNCSLLVLLLLSLILCLFTPQILRLTTPGFSPAQIERLILLTRIMFLSPILFCVSAIFSGIVQYFDRFLVYGLAPILYNLGAILGILYLVPNFGITGLAWGVVLGALLYFLIQIPAAKEAGFHYSKILNLKDHAFSKMFKLTIPSAIGSAFAQINLVVITAFCSTLAHGSIAIFTFSKDLQAFPVSMIGVPFAISAFPVLSRNWACKKKQEFWHNLSLALREVLFLIIPISTLVIILRAQIVRIILGAGLWGWTETRLTAACLGAFALSIFAFSVIPILQKGFYSIQDTKTPTRVQIFTVFINIVLAIAFLLLLKSSEIFTNFFSNVLKLENIRNIQVLSFPLAMTISGILQSLLLFFILAKKTGVFNLKELTSSLYKILISTFLMGVGAWGVLRPLAHIFPLDTFWAVFFQAAIASLTGSLIYLLASLALKSPEIESLRSSFVKSGNKIARSSSNET